MAIDEAHPLLLASGSPRRRELLTRVGIPLVVSPVEVDESVRPGEGADAYLERIVADKLAAARLQAPCVAVLVADTSVIVDGAILGKPEDEAEARRMIAALAGREHRVATRFALRGANGEERAETVSATVLFRELRAEEIDRYVATGEGRDKAGAYAIQGIGAMLVASIQGDYANVVGLPLVRVIVALQELGLVDTLPVAPGQPA